MVERAHRETIRINEKISGQQKVWIKVAQVTAQDRHKSQCFIKRSKAFIMLKILLIATQLVLSASHFPVRKC